MLANQTVFVVDDDVSARESVAALACSIGAKAETFSSAEEFLEQYQPDRAGCLVTDLRMLGMSGTELQEKLAADGIRLPVIIITAHAETPITVRAVKSGAVTVLEKPCRDYELFNAIRDALNMDNETRTRVEQGQRLNSRFDTLSPDEKTVLEFMMEGVANKVIARRLDISTRTVEKRRQRIFEKTNTESLAELIQCVVETRSIPKS